MMHHAGGSCGRSEGVLEGHKGCGQCLAFGLALQAMQVEHKHGIRCRDECLLRAALNYTS